jgi:hypothetical protein
MAEPKFRTGSVKLTWEDSEEPTIKAEHSEEPPPPAKPGTLGARWPQIRDTQPIPDKPPERHPDSTDADYKELLMCWYRDQHALADREASQNRNPVNMRWDSKREKEQRVLAAAESIIARGEHNHKEMANIFADDPTAEGLSRDQLLNLFKKHLREIGRVDLIFGWHARIPE